MSSVDVVVPCYKYAHYLHECVESVLQQENVDVRVLIIDDCSPDHTPEVGQQLAADDRRVEYRRHEQNQGHIATYNEGLLGWAAAEYVLLLSADDLLIPGALQRATHLMDAHPNVVMTYGQAPTIQRSKPLPELPAATEIQYEIVTGHDFIADCCQTSQNIVPTPTAIARTSVQQSIGGYRTELPHTGDMEMWMRFALHGDIGVLQAPQAFYSWHGQNMSNGYQRPGLGDIHERRDAFNSLFANAGTLTPQLTAMQSQALTRIAWDAFWGGCVAWEGGDRVTCRECMDYAQSILPEIANTRAWKNQMWKLKLGPRLIGIARSLKRCLTRNAPSGEGIASQHSVLKTPV